MTSRDSERMIRITSRPTEPEAAIVVGALEDAGIRAVMSGQYSAGFKAEAPGWVAISIFEKDRQAAEEVLANIGSEEREPIDWSQVDVGRPEDER